MKQKNKQIKMELEDYYRRQVTEAEVEAAVDNLAGFLKVLCEIAEEVNYE